MSDPAARNRAIDFLGMLGDFFGAAAAAASVPTSPLNPALKSALAGLAPTAEAFSALAESYRQGAEVPSAIADALESVWGNYTGLQVANNALAALRPVLLVQFGITLSPLAAFIITAFLAYAASDLYGHIFSSLTDVLLYNKKDPLILDLDGDGIETVALEGSSVHFDYDGDGFAERTGWAAADDGILAFDANGNGVVDGMHELFGSPTQDGFEVLETLDSNNDGTIDAADARFTDLRVWRDLDQDGVTDAGELMTLAEAGVASISLTRTDVAGTTNGHDIGFGGSFTRTDGSTGTAQTIYFATDRQDTIDPTPAGFVPAEGVEALPLLPGSGTIFSMAYALSNDATLRADWTALTDSAATLSATDLHAAFESLMLRWAGVDTLDPTSRGYYVDARHLAFVEAYFGDTYQEQTLLTGEISTVPTTVVLYPRGEGRRGCCPHTASPPLCGDRSGARGPRSPSWRVPTRLRRAGRDARGHPLCHPPLSLPYQGEGPRRASSSTTSSL